MSRFYGSLTGQAKTTATRRGSTIVEAHVRGWDFGVYSQVHKCRHCGGDAVKVFTTGGSNNPACVFPCAFHQCENGCPE